MEHREYFILLRNWLVSINPFNSSLQKNELTPIHSKSSHVLPKKELQDTIHSLQQISIYREKDKLIFQYGDVYNPIRMIQVAFMVTNFIEKGGIVPRNLSIAPVSSSIYLRSQVIDLLPYVVPQITTWILRWRNAANCFTVQAVVDIYRAVHLAKVLLSFVRPGIMNRWLTVCAASCIGIGVPISLFSMMIGIDQYFLSKIVPLAKMIKISKIKLPPYYLHVFSKVMPSDRWIQQEQLSLFLTMTRLIDHTPSTSIAIATASLVFARQILGMDPVFPLYLQKESGFDFGTIRSEVEIVRNSFTRLKKESQCTGEI